MAEPEDDTAAFFAALPQDPFTGPRTFSRSVTFYPRSVGDLLAQLAAMPVIWIWRGQQRFDWSLETRLARDFARLPAFDDPDMSYDFVGLENKIIGFFKERARRSLVPPPDDLDVLSWLAAMQHYGAPTRLMDWTASPFVGLWFAYSDLRDGAAALWGLNAYLCRRQVSGSLMPRGWDHLGVIAHSVTDRDGVTTTRYPALETKQRDRENDVIRWAIRNNNRWPVPVIPFDTDARMTAQQTVLTCIGDLRVSVDETLLRYEDWQHTRPDEQPPGGFYIGTDSTIWPLREPADLLMRIHLPGEWRLDVLRALSRMGIDASTLFPGLDGVGRETSMYLDAGAGSVREVITDTLGI